MYTQYQHMPADRWLYDCIFLKDFHLQKINPVDSFLNQVQTAIGAIMAVILGWNAS